MAEFSYQPTFPLSDDATAYRKLDAEPIEAAEFAGRPVIQVPAAALTTLARQAMHDIAFFYRASHLAQVSGILTDPGSSPNDRGVAAALLHNAEIAAREVLPMCQDTGTAIVHGKKGQQVWTGVDDAEHIARGIFETYARDNLRYSQLAPLSMYAEKNTGTNLPAQIEIEAVPGDAYRFLFVAKGGGSANKALLFQETPALLRPDKLEPFLAEKLATLGTAGCPPYHIAVVIGGTSAELTMKAVKLASTRYLDTLPTEGSPAGHAFRDRALEEKVVAMAERTGLGAQFGGKHFALDARVIRLPRHGASLPIGLGISCSADRQARGRIDRDGVWLEELERQPARFVPPQFRGRHDQRAVRIDLRRPMKEILAELTQHPVTTQLALTGTLVVARDLAHARLKERLDRGEGLPDYIKDHPVYYAGPAKTPAGLASGSFGPTTAGRMDSYVDLLQSHGGSLVMIAKGNRSAAVTEACKRHGGFYLGSIGGPAASLAQDHIRKVEVLDYAEMGMEAVYRIEVVDFPAFILVDDKGNDFFAQLRR